MRKTRNHASSTLQLRKETVRSLATELLLNVEGASASHCGDCTYLPNMNITDWQAPVVGARGRTGD